MSTVTSQAIRDSLKQCMDPEVPLNIVDMGLIYGIDVLENNDVNIKMTMTTQGCPLHETLVQDVTRYAKKVPGVNNVKVDIVWNPPWTMEIPDRVHKPKPKSHPLVLPTFQLLEALQFHNQLVLELTYLLPYFLGWLLLHQTFYP